jgi:hypothetical protein
METAVSINHDTASGNEHVSDQTVTERMHRDAL